CSSDSCSSGVCVCPSHMVEAPVIGGGSFYCIDVTEVSYSDYLTFYDANPSIANQPAECSWNTTWTPSNAWPPAHTALPVSYVNWCQALAYCTFEGKTLCGQIGGGAVLFGDLVDAHQDQWFNACTAQGNFTYPYGKTYSATECNGADAMIDAVWST